MDRNNQGMLVSGGGGGGGREPVARGPWPKRSSYSEEATVPNSGHVAALVRYCSIGWPNNWPNNAKNIRAPTHREPIRKEAFELLNYPLIPSLPSCSCWSPLLNRWRAELWGDIAGADPGSEWRQARSGRLPARRAAFVVPGGFYALPSRTLQAWLCCFAWWVRQLFVPMVPSRV